MAWGIQVNVYEHSSKTRVWRWVSATKSDAPYSYADQESAERVIRIFYPQTGPKLVRAAEFDSYPIQG